MAIGLPSLHDRVGSCRPRCRRKPRLNRPIASTRCGTRSAGRTSSPRPTGAAAPIAARRGSTARRSRRSRPTASEAWLEGLRQELCAGLTGHGPCCVSGYPRATAASARSAFPRSATGWCRRRWSSCSSRSSRRTCCRTSTASARARRQDGGPPRLLARHGQRDAPRWWTRTCATTSGAIPHGPLLRCLARRVADGTVLSVIKSWLEMPVVERTAARRPGAPPRRGTAPGDAAGRDLLALARQPLLPPVPPRLGAARPPPRLDAHVVNYADDFVICCRPGNGRGGARDDAAADGAARVDGERGEDRLARLPEDQLRLPRLRDRSLPRQGREPFIGTRPSRKAVKRLIRAIHDATTPRWYPDEPTNRIRRLNTMIRGWAGYFDQGPVVRVYRAIQLLHRTARPTLVDAPERPARHGVPPIPRRVPLRGARPLQAARPPCRPAECEGLRSQGRAGCGKSARPVRRAGTGNGATPSRTEGAGRKHRRSPPEG